MNPSAGLGDQALFLDGRSGFEEPAPAPRAATILRNELDPPLISGSRALSANQTKFL
jgi:hypothetical protein